LQLGTQKRRQIPLFVTQRIFCEVCSSMFKKTSIHEIDCLSNVRQLESNIDGVLREGRQTQGVADSTALLHPKEDQVVLPAREEIPILGEHREVEARTVRSAPEDHQSTWRVKGLMQMRTRPSAWSSCSCRPVRDHPQW
jgi:hypothetical protein